jgi:4-azaleucine resistance transporter AzlC
LLKRLHPDAWRAARAGALYSLALTPSYLVFGAVCGLAAKQAGFSALQALALPALVFGGSSQVVLVQLILAGAPLLVVIMSAVMVNARMAVYSAALSQWLLHAPQRLRTAVAPLLVDQTYAALEQRTAQLGAREKHWLAYYFGAGLTLWFWWVVCNALGYFVGSVMPAQWELDFVVPLSFVAVMAPMMKKARIAAACVLGGLLGVAFFALPLKLGLMVACVVGVCAMLTYELVADRPPGSGAR